MVYGYKTNKEFIDKSYQLLEKLEDKGLWNKDTLVICLDKSVRPLAYTLRKLSDMEGKEKPDVRFFNYSHRHNFSELKEISNLLKKQMESKEEKGIKYKRIRKPENYKKILILDEHISSGRSLKDAKKIILSYLSDTSKKPRVEMAALGPFVNNGEDYSEFISLEQENVGNAEEEDLGIRDKNAGVEWYKIPLKESERIPFGEIRQKFLANRYQLSKDIKQYLHEKHPEKVSGKNKGLEKIISGIFVFSFLVGLFFSFGNLTGSVIGNSSEAQKLLGIILVLVGIGGFFVYQKFRE